VTNNLRAIVLLLGLGALLVAPFVLPHGRNRVERDPHLAAMMHLLEVTPGMSRSVLESHLHRFTKRPDGVEVFSHPDSDALRLDVRLDDTGPAGKVIAVGSPYLSYFPEPDHLK
jgi:hypothetical protein